MTTETIRPKWHGFKPGRRSLPRPSAVSLVGITPGGCWARLFASTPGIKCCFALRFNCDIYILYNGNEWCAAFYSNGRFIEIPAFYDNHSYKGIRKLTNGDKEILDDVVKCAVNLGNI